MKSLLIGWLLVLGLPGLAAADELYEAAGRYQIDPSSNITFLVSQVGGGGINGRFDRFSGSFNLDGRNLGRSKVEFILFPKSVSTGQSRVDNFLRSDAIFDVAQFSQITFRSTRISRTAENEAIIEGILTAKGRSRAATFRAQLQQRSAGSIAFRVLGDIYRTFYGMDAGTPIYSNIVHFDMVLHGRRS